MNNNELVAELLTEAAYLLDEGAHFSFIPKFKALKEKYPELKTSDDIINQVSELLDTNNSEMTEKQGIKITQVILVIIKYIYSASSAVLLPFCIFIGPIIPMLLTRLVVWASEYGIHEMEISKLRSSIEDIKKLKEKTTDKKVKEKCDQMIESINETIKKLK